MELIKKMKETLNNRDEGQNNFYIDCQHDDPVGQDAIKDTLALIKVAYESHCDFNVTFVLKIGDFSFDAAMFNDIKLLKATKNEPERIMVSYSNALLVYDVTIKVDDITCIDFNLKYHSNGSMEDV